MSESDRSKTVLGSTQEAVEHAFNGVKPTFDDSVPDIILENRRKRAELRIADALKSASWEGKGDLNLLFITLPLLVRKWAAAGFVDSFDGIDRFEITCAHLGARRLVEAGGDALELLEVYEREHRARVCKRFGEQEFRGLQSNQRIWGKLDDVYVPLQLRPIDRGHASGEEPQPFVVRDRRMAVNEVLAEHRRVVLIGRAGSGKTTLVARLASQMAAEGIGGETLPFVLTVRRFDDSSIDVDTLAHHTGSEKELLVDAIRGNRAALIIDGLDETEPSRRENLLASLGDFVVNFPGLRVVATSRPNVSSRILEGGIADFRSFQIEDLTSEDIEQFIRKWCVAAERSIRKDDPVEAEKKGLMAAEDLTHLIRRNNAVQRLAANPLLASVLCIVHRFHGQEISERRTSLYAQCTDALLYKWDRSKFKTNQLSPELGAHDKRRLLMRLARSLHERHATEAEETEVVESFAATLPTIVRSSESARHLLDEVRERSGLLIELSSGHFAFSHLTFQEYLTALDMAEADDDEIASRSGDIWWHEVLVLWSGLSNVRVDGLINFLLKKDNRGQTLLAAKCASAAIELPIDLREKVDQRLLDLGPPGSSEEQVELSSVGPLVGPLFVRGIQMLSPVTVWSLLGIIDNLLVAAIPAIHKLCKSKAARNTNVPNLRLPTGTPGLLTLAGWGCWALLRLYLREESASARRAYDDAVHRVNSNDLKAILAWCAEQDQPDSANTPKTDALERAVKAARRALREGTSSSIPAPRTEKGRRKKGSKRS